MPKISINNEELTYNNIIYVDAINGDDTNGDGSESSPLATVTKAYSQASDGDAIYLIGNDSANYNDYTGSIDKQIDFIGDGLNSIMDFGANSVLGNSTANVSFYRINIFADEMFRDSGNYNYNYYNCIIVPQIGTFNYDTTSSYPVGFYNCIIDFTKSTNRTFYRDDSYFENCIIFGAGDSSSSWGHYGDVHLVTTQVNDDFIDEDTAYIGPSSSSYSYTVNSDYTIDGFDITNKGTGTDPDGSDADLGIYGGTYAWGAWRFLKYLFRENNNIKTYNDGWVTLGTTLTQKMFKNNGIEKLSKIDNSLNELENLEILVWDSDYQNTTTKQTSINANPKPQLILANDDINIENISQVNNISISSNISPKQSFLEDNFGQISGDTRIDSFTFDCSNASNVLVSFDLSSSSMDNSNENVHFLWHTGSEWKLIGEVHNDSQHFDVAIPKSWLSDNNKVQLDINSGSTIHSDGNGVIDYASANNIEVKELNDYVRVIVSDDSGTTWYTYNDGWIEITTDTSVVGTDGITISQINEIPNTDWNTFFSGDTIRFGYYLNKDNINDSLEIATLSVDADMNGRWKRGIHKTDYHYKYKKNNTFDIELLTDGDYKINYQS
jgi:hypothetical protein